MEGRAQGCCMQEMERRECITWGRLPLRGCSLGCAKRLLKGEGKQLQDQQTQQESPPRRWGFAAWGSLLCPTSSMASR